MTIRPQDPLSAAALIYLATPSFVFLFAWLEWPLAITALALLSIALVQLLRQLPSRPLPYSGFAPALIVIIAVLWSSLGGAGHLVYANIDWETRDTVYADLILAAWPPSYGVHDGAPLMLRTAMGYFLPPAALTKLAGIEWATMIILGWTALGVALFLALLPLPRQFGWRLALVALAVVFFSGMDYLGVLLVLGHVPIFPTPLEWWRQWTFSSLTAQLFWAPNHALALWLGAALVFRHRFDFAMPSLALVMLPLLLLWTPFAVIGLLPWVLWSLWVARLSLLRAFQRTGAAQWLSAILLTSIIGSLFATKGVATDFAPRVGAYGPTGQIGGLDLELVLNYIQFAGCEFVILALLLVPFVGALRGEFALAVGLLLLIPLFRFGPSNDWALRVSTPSLVILMIVTISVLVDGLNDRLKLRRQIPILVVLLIGALTPYFEFSRAVLWRRTAPNYGESLVEQQRGYLAPHYIGRLDRPELQIIFKKPGLVPNAQERRARVPLEFRRPQ